MAYATGIALHFAGILPESIKYVLYGISLVFGFLAILVGYSICFNKKVKMYLGLWILFIIYLSIVGAFKSDFYSQGTSINIFLSQDLRFVMYVGVGILFADGVFFDNYIEIMKKIAFVSIIMGFFALANYNFSYAVASEGQRLGLWSLPYYLWWASGSVFAFMYPYSHITGKNKVLGYGSFMAYATLGLLFIKRASMVNSILIIIVSELFCNTRGNKKNQFAIFKIIISLLIILGIAYAIPYSRALLSAMIDRFGSQGGALEYDRAREAQAVFAVLNSSDVFFGQGIGHYVQGERLINALHTGLYNLVYKGGVLFVLMFVYFVIKTIKNVITNRSLSATESICLCTSVSYLCSMFYEASWSYTIYMVQYATPIVALLTHSLVYEEEMKL